MADLSVDLAPGNPRELVLSNPVIAASGCFGYGQEYQGTIDIHRLGAFVSKGITPEPRSGNPMPRITETTGGMLNAIGLQNPGIRKFIRSYPPIWERWPTPAIVNISGETVAEFAEMARLLDDVPGVAGLEVNISCPNINAGGFCFGWDADMSREVTAAVRAATTLPIIVKLSPGALDVAQIALAVEEGGADAVSLINTLVGMKIDTRRRKPVLANGTGGLSGPAIRPVAVRMTWQVARVVGIPVVGLGGIMSLDDGLEFFMAGASAIQVGTGFFAQPGRMVAIADELDAWLDAQGCSSLGEIVGAALPDGLPPRRQRIDPDDLKLMSGDYAEARTTTT
ncbi:MAG TPA: dihydroorotate dehydrogenase [Thermomicrobiales bacterium]|jgi:dihydroorotate dehydrogenase (NAD+) catalytic subunit|nr:dihydroorotate dehydrogenase [Thermomicrobiales bacterium]